MKNYVRLNEVPIQNLIGFYDSIDDYNIPLNVRIFESKEMFNEWYRFDRLKELNPNIKVYDISSMNDIKLLLDKKSYTKVKNSKSFC